MSVESLHAELLQAELHELRKSIRQDLREELSRALEGVGNSTGVIKSSMKSSSRADNNLEGPRKPWGHKVEPPMFADPVVMFGEEDGDDEKLRDTAAMQQRVDSLECSEVESEKVDDRLRLEAHEPTALRTPGVVHFDTHGSPELLATAAEQHRSESSMGSANGSPQKVHNDPTCATASKAGQRKKIVSFPDEGKFGGGKSFLQQTLLTDMKRASKAPRKEKDHVRHSGGRDPSARKPSLDSVHSFTGSQSISTRDSIRKLLNRSDAVEGFDDEEGNKPKDKLTFEEVFELISAVAIVVNGTMIGVQTEILSLRRTETTPMFFYFAEIAFCAVFTSELLVRVYNHYGSFFSHNWNIFDSVLVVLQLTDLLMETFKNFSSGATFQLSFLRMLRILRILRVMRLVRLLKFFGELNVVTSAIVNSMKSLYGTVLMLFLMIYIFAIAFTGAANSHLVHLKESGVDFAENPVHIWWNSLGRTVLSLYESILGGVDWDDLMQGLLEMNVAWALVFLVYISFMMLTMLNVITGIFVDSAVKHAERYHEKEFEKNMRRLFRVTDLDKSGTISRDEIENWWTRSEFMEYLHGIGVEPREAQLLFNLLDNDANNDIDAEEFLAGMLRLRAGAKFIDIMNLQHVIEHPRNTLNSEGKHENFITRTLSGTRPWSAASAEPVQ